MAFLGIQNPPHIAQALAALDIPGEKEPLNHSHITLVYLGKEVPLDQITRAIEAVFKVAHSTEPFEVWTSQIASFPPNKDDGVPIICPIQSDGIHGLRKAVVEALQDHGVPFNNKYPDYKPHTTLGYSQDVSVYSERAADRDIPRLAWTITEMVLWGGDQGEEKLTVTIPFSPSIHKQSSTIDAVYRMLVRMASAKKTACQGGCSGSCSCGGTCSGSCGGACKKP